MHGWKVITVTVATCATFESERNDPLINNVHYFSCFLFIFKCPFSFFFFYYRDIFVRVFITTTCEDNKTISSIGGEQDVERQQKK